MGDRETEGGQSKTSGGDPPAPHALLIPGSLISHALPLLKVAIRLASHGIKVSFVVYEDEVSSMSLHLPPAGEQPQHDRNFRFLEVPRASRMPVYHEFEFQEALKSVLEKFAQDKQNGVPGGPTCLFVDMFVPWTTGASELLKIPRYVLITSGVIFGKYLLEYACNYDRGLYKIHNRELVPFEGYVTDPGCPSLTYRDLPQRSRKIADNVVLCSRALWTAAGVLFNSFAELEQGVIEAWKLARENPRTEHPKVPATYIVGPLLATASAKNFVPSDSGLKSSGDIAYQWLISQPPSSVLYVAFGSRSNLSREQAKGLALGLEASEQRFLWVLPKRAPTSDSGLVQDYLPEGFQERVSDRGCIVHGWVSQVQILSHTSTAGFLSHCGWNSVLESILNGVPLIAWPQAAEQRLNCRYLLDKVKLAIELQTSDDNVASPDQVKDAVLQLLVAPGGEELKARMKEFQKMSQTAMSEGGSQSSNYQRLFHDVCIGFANH